MNSTDQGTALSCLDWVNLSCHFSSDNEPVSTPKWQCSELNEVLTKIKARAKKYIFQRVSSEFNKSGLSSFTPCWHFSSDNEPVSIPKWQCSESTLSKADTLGTKATVRFREVSALERVPLPRYKCNSAGSGPNLLSGLESVRLERVDCKCFHWTCAMWWSRIWVDHFYQPHTDHNLTTYRVHIPDKLVHYYPLIDNGWESIRINCLWCKTHIGFTC